MEDAAFIMKIAGILFLILLLGMPQAAAEPDSAQPAGRNMAQDSSMKQKVSSFDLEGYSNKGVKQWDVKGKSAKMEGGGLVKMSNVTANAYGKDARATVTADRGVYNKKKNRVTLNDNVDATIEYTETAAQDFMQMDLGSSASAKGAERRAKKKKTTITCKGEVEFDYENNIVFFRDNVLVKSADGGISADTITVFLGSKTKEIDQIVAEGNVKIVRDGNITYSRKATYIQAEKRIILSGSPRLVFYQEGDFAKSFTE